MSIKTTHPVVRAALGIAALVLIAIFANWLVSLTPIGNHGKDFTENKIHTLSDGTRSILAELDSPVTIHYYATRNATYMPEEVKLHMRRVDDLLKEYANLSKGKLRVEMLDPQPDTDAEDSANLDGISGQRFEDENLYFGLAISCLDRKATIPFLDPNDETMLEYHLSRSIAEVSAPAKPVIGLMSAFNLAGGSMSMPGQQQPDQPWIIYQQLKQSYEVRNLTMNPGVINPKEIKALLVFHPANITPEAEFAIDQYLLQGGTVIACLDSYSVAAQMLGGGGNPMMGGGGGIPTTSTLPTLLGAWGVTFDSTQSLADAKYATRVAGERVGAAVLTLPKEAMPQKDNVITKDLSSVTFFLPGGFHTTGGGGVTSNTLIKSSDRAALVDSMAASQLDQSLLTSMRPTGETFDLLLHLSGNFKTAFPKGKPGAEETAKPEEKKGADKKDAKPEEKKDTTLKTSTSPGNVFLIPDVDAFYDRFAYNVQNFGGSALASPSNGNSTLLLNLIDQAAGSKYLIGARSRSASRRPFTVIQNMEADFNLRVGKKVAEIKEEEKKTQERLTELQSQKSRGKELYLSPEQEAEIRKLQQQEIDAKRKIREQEKDLQKQKDELGGRITLLNVAAMPALVIIAGVGYYFRRRSLTRAR